MAQIGQIRVRQHSVSVASLKRRFAEMKGQTGFQTVPTGVTAAFLGEVELGTALEGNRSEWTRRQWNIEYW